MFRMLHSGVFNRDMSQRRPMNILSHLYVYDLWGIEYLP